MEKKYIACCLLVALKFVEQVQSVIYNKSNIQGNIVIKKDRTDFQRMLLKQAYLEKEEKEKEQGVEYIIKHIKGIPKAIPKLTNDVSPKSSKNSKAIKKNQKT